MKLHGVKLKLDPAQDGIEFEEDDWSVVPGTRFISHLPSHITFEIALDEEAHNKECASLFDFSACPIEICEGRAIPKRDELLLIGQQAIVVFLKAIGSYVPRRPGEKSCVGEPDLSVN